MPLLLDSRDRLPGRAQSSFRSRRPARQPWRAAPKRERREAWSETEHTIDQSHKLSLRLGARGRKAIFTVRDASVDIELFDLAADPGELLPLGPTPINDPMRKAFEKRLEDYLHDMAAARQGSRDIPTVELDPEERERLRSLGYIR